MNVGFISLGYRGTGMGGRRRVGLFTKWIQPYGTTRPARAATWRRYRYLCKTSDTSVRGGRRYEMKATSQPHIFRSTVQLLLVVVAFVALKCSPAAKADEVSDGKAAFSTCSTCHTVTGKDSVGPHLNGVIGRKAGSVAGFDYSPAMKESKIVWDTTALEKFIQDPQAEIPGNHMPFAGLQDENKRDAIVAYLASLK